MAEAAENSDKNTEKRRGALALLLLNILQPVMGILRRRYPAIERYCMKQLCSSHSCVRLFADESHIRCRSDHGKRL
jgi:hypothetical protein